MAKIGTDASDATWEDLLDKLGSAINTRRCQKVPETTKKYQKSKKVSEKNPKKYQKVPKGTKKNQKSAKKYQKETKVTKNTKNTIKYQTLPEAQRTQGIESITWINFFS